MNAAKVMCEASVRYQRARHNALKHPCIRKNGPSGWRRDQAIAKARREYLATLRKVSPLAAMKAR